MIENVRLSGYYRYDFGLKRTQRRCHHFVEKERVMLIDDHNMIMYD